MDFYIPRINYLLMLPKKTMRIEMENSVISEGNGFTCRELTKETWDDLVSLFGDYREVADCWCMWFRGSRKEWEDNRGAGNKSRLKAIVDNRKRVGLIAYSGTDPVGWCAVAPRIDYDVLERTKFYKAIDNKNSWSITCFFTIKTHRKMGVTRFLISEAIKYARNYGAEVLEAYPSVPKEAVIPDVNGYRGFYQVFLGLGFVVVSRKQQNKTILRYDLKK
jgi:GNAT superfamily N-acetyltransferase